MPQRLVFVPKCNIFVRRHNVIWIESSAAKTLHLAEYRTGHCFTKIITPNRSISQFGFEKQIFFSQQW